MGKVDFDGILKEVCLAYVPEIQVGDYTIVHVGFAITQLDEQEAQGTLALFREMGALEEELNSADSLEPAYVRTPELMSVSYTHLDVYKRQLL